MDLAFIDDVRVELVKSLNTRFNYLKTDDIYGLAAILDPNGGIDWLQTHERRMWIGKLETALLLFDDQGSPNKSGGAGTIPLATGSVWFQSFKESQEVASNQTTIQKFLNAVEIAKNKHKLEQSERLAILREKDPKAELSYMDCIDVCQFWKELSRQKEFRKLSFLARKLLGIPASSASVERVFSKTGLIMRPHRNRLEDELAQDIFFLKSNQKLL
jgi:hypothetical protein